LQSFFESLYRNLPVWLLSLQAINCHRWAFACISLEWGCIADAESIS